MRRFDCTYNPSRADRWISDMESSLPQKARQARSRRRLIAAFLIYGTMVAGLLGFFAVFPDAITRETQAEARLP
jgi:hypothetical protein